MKRFLSRLNARFQAWLDYTVVADAPTNDLGSLDVRDGIGTRAPFDDWDDARPCGECPPMTYAQAAQMARDALPTRPPLYDQDYPLASEVEAWLSGGAR